VVHYDWCLDEWQRDVRAHIQAQVARPEETLLISAESLCRLRHVDEVERLRDLLSPREMSVVVVLRDPVTLGPSWEAETEKAGFPPSPYPQSFAYRGPAPWVFDFDAMLEPFRSVLGADRVHSTAYERSLERFESVIPAILEPFRSVLGADRVHSTGYERSLERFESVIPAILEPFGYPAESLPSWSGAWKNVSAAAVAPPGSGPSHASRDAIGARLGAKPRPVP
jgi:hypothetical protein